MITVTDGQGARASLPAFDLTVVNVNDPPIVDAGPDQMVAEGAQVTLSGSNSFDRDPGDSIASYQWAQINGPPVMLFDSGTVQPTFSAPDVGVGGESLTFKLSVTDTRDLYEEDTCVISVEWQIEYKLFGLNFSP